jgi:hypothetical protein
MAVLIGVPTYDDKVNTGLAAALIAEGALPHCPVYTVAFKAVSLLALGHNELLCLALNNRPDISHLLIVHADILPDRGFLIQMLSDMEEAHADVLGAIVPIKDGHGLTSTAYLPHLGPPDAQGRYEFRRRRLTIKEATRLPDLFDVHDIQHLFSDDSPDGVLLVNTGLLLLDVRQPFAERVHFEINDAIFTNGDGKFIADVEPEDWYFSRQCALAGARVCVTRRVGLRHIGSARFPNKTTWGEWDTDQAWSAAPRKENGQHETQSVEPVS